MATMTVRIDKYGKTKIAVNGVAGVSCRDISRPLEQALGVVTQDTETEEMYATEIQELHQENG